MSWEGPAWEGGAAGQAGGIVCASKAKALDRGSGPESPFMQALPSFGTNSAGRCGDLSNSLFNRLCSAAYHVCEAEAAAIFGVVVLFLANHRCDTTSHTTSMSPPHTLKCETRERLQR